MSTRSLLAVAALAGSLAAALPAQAAPTPAVSVSGSGQFANDADWTLGWTFTTGPQALSVTALGLWVEQAYGGSLAPLPVAIWNASGGSAVASANVGACYPNQEPAGHGGFCYGSIAPVVLAANTEFVIGGLFLHTNLTNYSWDWSTFSVAPGLTFGHAVSRSGGTFGVPNGDDTAWASNGWFGPNFKFEVSDVPAPGTLALLGIGALAAALRRRRG
ncbi:MAG: PEP-CTERM sorting domain-containing protein [Burkholderiaceae bacterium]